MDWILTNVGGVIIILTFLYVAVKVSMYYAGQFLCYLEKKKVHHG